MGEPADGAVEKILVLIELHDVMAWDGVHHHSIPGLVLLRVKLTVHGTLSFLAAFSGGISEIPRNQTMRILSFIEDPVLVRKILVHLKLWDTPASPRSPTPPDITYYPDFLAGLTQ